MNIDIPFNLRDKILIKPIGLCGYLEEISIGLSGSICYRVGYWNNGERQSIWMIEELTQPIPPP